MPSVAHSSPLSGSIHIVHIAKMLVLVRDRSERLVTVLARKTFWRHVYHGFVRHKMRLLRKKKVTFFAMERLLQQVPTLHVSSQVELALESFAAHSALIIFIRTACSSPRARTENPRPFTRKRNHVKCISFHVAAQTLRLRAVFARVASVLDRVRAVLSQNVGADTSARSCRPCRITRHFLRSHCFKRLRLRLRFEVRFNLVEAN
mmetsp:Transcript_13749/g.36903  ORF Transcript_13749/g.36903 Transcript_13749/m.36903 type:complete len:205 (-) Transcript_13749:1045-1659(-)